MVAEPLEKSSGISFLFVREYCRCNEFISRETQSCLTTVQTQPTLTSGGSAFRQFGTSVWVGACCVCRLVCASSCSSSSARLLLSPPLSTSLHPTLTLQLLAKHAIYLITNRNTPTENRFSLRAKTRARPRLHKQGTAGPSHTHTMRSMLGWAPTSCLRVISVQWLGFGRLQVVAKKLVTFLTLAHGVPLVSVYTTLRSIKSCCLELH